MKQCLKCAIQVDDGAKICRRCGSILEEIAAADDAARASPATSSPSSSGPPDPSPLPDPIDQFVAESFEWSCPGCGEQIERQFDACWKCGTNREGSSLPDFTLESDDDEPAARDEFEVPAEASLPADLPGHADQQSIPRSRDCLRCGSDKIITGVNVVSFASGELAAGRLELMALEDHERMLFMGRQARLTADVCGNCGHVELRAENVRGLPQRRREHW